jgi:hypothetical protein
MGGKGVFGITCFSIDTRYEADTIDPAMVARKSLGTSTQRVLRVERHEVCNL